MWKWILVFALAFTFIGGTIPSAIADGDIEISVNMPLDGLFKRNQWARVEIEITNNGAPFSGMLHLMQPRTVRQKPLLSKPVTVPGSESIQVMMDIPSEALMVNKPLEVLLESNKITAANHSFMPLLPTNERVVAVLDDKTDAFHFLAGIQKQQRLFKLQQINPESLPSESWILHNIDVLAIGTVESKAISDQQLSAIKEWLYRGGVVVLSGIAGQDELIQRFSDLLPIQFQPGEVLSEKRWLEQLDQEPLAEPIKVYDQNLSLFEAKRLGAGLLLFANFDIHADPLTSWKYNRQLWERVLTEHDVIGVTNNEKMMIEADMLSDVSKLMPEVTPPTFRWVLTVWLLYIIVVAPLLYFLLKRVDRREWSWFAIPIVAVLLSIGVFTIGRTQVVSDDTTFHVSHVRLYTDDVAEIQTSGSFLNISGGEYAVTAREGFFAVPYPFRFGGNSSDGSYISLDSNNKREIQFRKIPYLTLRQAIATGIRTQIGTFSTHLTADKNVLSGSVKNNTSYDMEEVFVQIGFQKIPVGSLKQGEEKEITATIEKYYLPDELQDRRIETREEEINYRKKRLLELDDGNRMRLIGVSSQPLHVFSPINREYKQQEWNIFTQSITIEATNGHVVYPYGTLPVYMQTDRGEWIAPYSIHMVNESVIFALAVSQVGIDVEYIEIPLDQSPYRPFAKEIFNVKNNEWEKLGRDQQVVLTDNLKDYLNPEGKVLIRVSNPGDGLIVMPQPIFHLEGKERTAQ